jgi:hypothetical protein
MTDGPRSRRLRRLSPAAPARIPTGGALFNSPKLAQISVPVDKQCVSQHDDQEGDAPKCGIWLHGAGIRSQCIRPCRVCCRAATEGVACCISRRKHSRAGTPEGR